LKVSKTIADLLESEEIKVEQLAEVIHYNSLDRELGESEVESIKIYQLKNLYPNCKFK
jgi:hypothetical protein